MNNILVAIMCIIAVIAGVWVWWIENGGSNKKEQDEDKNGEKEAEE